MTEHKEAEAIIKELGCLPLAIEQAGAYIWAQGSALAEYLLEYKSNFQSVTENRSEGLEGYATVYTTWQTSLEAIKRQNWQAAELLHLYGFLSNDVSDELILHGADEQIAKGNETKWFKTCIKLLLSYSLVKREGGKHRVWIHPVVHVWTRQHLKMSEKQQQTEHALKAVANCISWKAEETNSEKKLNFARDILPDVEACVTNVIDYLQDRSELNYTNWEHFICLRNFLQEKGVYDHSCILAKLLKDEHEKCFGKQNLETFTSMSYLALLYQYQGKYADAEPLYKDALAGYQKAFGHEHPDTLTSMDNLALLYRYQGKYADAEPLNKDALAGYQKALGHEHPDTLTSMSNLALLYQYQGKYADAEPLYKDALAGYQKALGHEHPHTLTSMSNLALLYQYQGKYADAEPLNKDALAGYQKALGHEHPHTLTSMSNLALLYKSQRKYTDAEPLYKDALAEHQKALEHAHPDTLLSMNNFASLY